MGRVPGLGRGLGKVHGEGSTVGRERGGLIRSNLYDLSKTDSPTLEKLG